MIRKIQKWSKCTIPMASNWPINDKKLNILWFNFRKIGFSKLNFCHRITFKSSKQHQNQNFTVFKNNKTFLNHRIWMKSSFKIWWVERYKKPRQAGRPAGRASRTSGNHSGGGCVPNNKKWGRNIWCQLHVLCRHVAHLQWIVLWWHTTWARQYLAKVPLHIFGTTCTCTKEQGSHGGGRQKTGRACLWEIHQVCRTYMGERVIFLVQYRVGHCLSV